MIKLISNKTNWLFFIFCAVFVFTFNVDSALANSITCTSDDALKASMSAGGGIVSAIMQTIVTLLNTTSKTLYNSVIGNSEFQAARNAVILLAITIYGAMLIFGIANFRPGEIVGILFKIGLIMMLTTGDAWHFFNEFIGDFFFGTMMDLVEVFMGQTAGAASSGYAGQADMATRLEAPLSVLNWPMARILSTQFFVTILGVFAIPTYGIILGLLMIWGGFNMLMALLGALFTYIKCIVGLWFLFALSPIFFLLLLFSRTRNLFEGWINMVVSFTLQPILLFAFLALFITITTVSLGDLMTTNWCWVDVEGLTEGMSDSWKFWRPVSTIVNGVPTVLDSGIWSMLGNLKDGKIDIVFPVDAMDVMFFLLSSYVAWQYSKFVPSLAHELSSSGLRLSVNAETARNFFSSRGWTPGQMAAKGVGAGMNFLK